MFTVLKWSTEALVLLINFLNTGMEQKEAL